MWHMGGDWAWWAWMPMMAFMLAFWGVVVWAVIAVVRRLGSAPTQGPGRNPTQILEERFASGEIDEQEYRRRRDVLASNRS